RQLPRRGRDRPPRAAAGSSTRPVVIRLSASASPEDWRSRSDVVARGAGRWLSLPDRGGPTASGWWADPRPLRVDAWRSNGAACEDARLSGCQLASRLAGRHTRSLWCRSGDQRYASGCLETAMGLACAVTDANARAAPRAAWSGALHRDL